MRQESITIEISTNHLAGATDMLRYDNAYDATYYPEREVWRIHLLQYTSRRWESFGLTAVEVKIVYEQRMNAREYKEALERALGFTEGMRFAQRFLETAAGLFRSERLVEG